MFNDIRMNGEYDRKKQQILGLTKKVRMVKYTIDFLGNLFFALQMYVK